MPARGCAGSDGELVQRQLPFHRSQVRQPILEQHERLLPADHWAAYAHPTQRRQDEHVHDGLTAHGYPGGRKRVPQRRPRPRPLRQHGPYHLDAAIGLRLVHAFLPEPGAVAGRQLRRREGVQPPEVLGAHQVQRAAVEPAHHQLALVQRQVDVRRSQPCGARPDPKPGSDQVLPLHRE